MAVVECGGEGHVGSADHAGGGEGERTGAAEAGVVQRAGSWPGDATNRARLGKRAVIRFELIALLASIHGTWSAIERVRRSAAHEPFNREAPDIVGCALLRRLPGEGQG